jgi:hypothetical protein
MEKIIIPENEVREYAEGYAVQIVLNEENNRLCVEATNEGGYNGTSIDLLDLLNWVLKNKPELINKPVQTTNEQPENMLDYDEQDMFG